MLRLLPIFALPLLGLGGLLGELTQSSEDVTLLSLLSAAALAVDCLFGRRGKRSNVFIFLLVCLFLYSSQVAVLLIRHIALNTRSAGDANHRWIHSSLNLPNNLPHNQAALKPQSVKQQSPQAGTSVQVLPPSHHPPVATRAPEVSGAVMRTMSIVLPCAEERENALLTVQRFCERTPEESLKEIIVVDDGSEPPLTKRFADDKRRLDTNPRCKVRILRHEKTIGLMAAKLTGGMAATGDVIGFFDCHCAPKPHWHEEILSKVTQSPRAMVVPAITDLDLDTFDEKVNSAVNAKCYLTFDADFKWFDDESDYIPTISGGLVAMGRVWFNQTGGFDEEMHGWGGENLDQSLRAWLCGGSIVRAKSSRIAHMWRTGDPRTRTHYRVKAKGTDNRGRVAAAWFDKFQPIYRGRKLPASEVQNFERVKKRLGCKPFSFFIYRFRRVYIEGGVIPAEVFNLREKKSGECLRHSGILITSPCKEGDGTQRWHPGNVDRKTGRCCSGLRAFKSNNCLDFFDAQGGHFYSCDVSGQNLNQLAQLREDGRIVRENNRCVYVDGTKVKQEDCSKLGEGQGVFEKIYVFEPEERKIYKSELAKHRYAEEMPDLPDN